MKPQQMDLNCELFDDFRQAMDAAIRSVLDRMIEKGLDSGSVTGKLDITLRTSVSETTGEVMYLPEIDPKVSMSFGTKAKIDCVKQMGFLAKLSQNGVVIGTDQVTMDELLEEIRT